jgi:hypothetical protein
MNPTGVAEWKVSDLVLTLHCPACSCEDVRRSRRKNLLEYLMVAVFFLRPFRCEKCLYRFYDHVFRRRAATPESAVESSIPALLNVPVVVYGCGQNGEIFHEDTGFRMRSAASGTLDLTVEVEPGQELILMDLDSEQEQRCRVASVRSTPAGTWLARIQFAGPAEKFWRTARPAVWTDEAAAS